MPEVVEADWFRNLGCNKGLAAAGEDDPAGIDVVGLLLGLEDFGGQSDVVVVKWN